MKRMGWDDQMRDHKTVDQIHVLTELHNTTVPIMPVRKLHDEITTRMEFPLTSPTEITQVQ